MKNRYVILVLAVMLWGLAPVVAQTKTFYDFTANTIEGENISMAQFKGKKLLVVNTASKCGLTPQYEELQALYEKFGPDGFVIIGFPANNFMKQEPGTNQEIAGFCQKNYGVSFQMMEKISVNGDDQHPIYKWLTTKELNGFADSKVKWNFQKYMIDETGKLVGVQNPKTKPLDPVITNWISGE